MTLFFSRTMLTQFLIHNISSRVLKINFIYIRHLNYLFHNVPFVNIPYSEDRDMFAFFFSFLNAHSRPRISFYFYFFSFEPSRSTANHRLKSHFFSLLWWAEWRKIIHEKYLFKKNYSRDLHGSAVGLRRKKKWKKIENFSHLTIFFLFLFSFIDKCEERKIVELLLH